MANIVVIPRTTKSVRFNKNYYTILKGKKTQFTFLASFEYILT